MKQSTKNIAFWVMILLVIGLGVYLVHWTNTESFQCVSDPYRYAIKHLEKSNDAEVSCICTVLQPNGASALLTRDGFEPVKKDGL